jgi:hypothetical protein
MIAFQNLIKAEEDINAATGVLWSACRDIQTAPESNCKQVALSLSYISEMIQDAFDEVEQLSQGLTFDGQLVNLDSNSSQYFEDVKSLIKLCILCVQKFQLFLNSCTEDEDLILESETLLLLGNELSSKIDDFVSILDIPLQFNEEFLFQSLERVFGICKDLLHRLHDGKWSSTAAIELSKLETSLGLFSRCRITR